MHWFKKNYFLFLILFVIFIFNYKFFIFGKLPVPSDTIVGMYHPFRDNVWDDYSAGVPYKNPLITDPVRQQYVWRELAISQVKKKSWPVWNPYSFSGTPLLANFQTAFFYPLNFLYFLAPFYIAWSWQIIISQIITAVFLFLYLGNLQVSPPSAFMAGIAFTFSGFAVSWLTWNTILHVAAWTILALLSIDKILQEPGNKKLNPYKWFFIFLFSLVSAFFSGHLQIFFYALLLVTHYLIFRIWNVKKIRFKTVFLFVICYLLFVIVTLPQSLPTLKFISHSARSIDQGQFSKPGWFIPWQNLIQYFAPDFFGNPSTGNYFGIWNYAEFIPYLGVIPLIFAMLAIIFVRNPLINFFSLTFLISLIFSLPTPLAKLPFIFNLPLISTAQPTRLVFLSDLALSVLSASGLDFYLRMKNAAKIRYVFISALIFLIILWLIAVNPVSRRNLIFPSLIFGIFAFLIFLNTRIKHLKLILVLILSAAVFDSLRFAWKFTPFTNSNWLFPSTDIISTIKQDTSLFRIMSLDRRIMPPNFSVFYRLQDVSGYDPLYLSLYNVIVSSWNSNQARISGGSFNRIVTPEKFDSIISRLLNVKYTLSYGSDDSGELELIKNTGETYLYRNKNFLPRVWLADRIIREKSQQEELTRLFELEDDIDRTVVTSENLNISLTPIDAGDSVRISKWQENKIAINTKIRGAKILVLSEIYYPVWKARVDGKEVKIFRVNFFLRALPLEAGEHTVEFYPEIL